MVSFDSLPNELLIKIIRTLIKDSSIFSVYPLLDDRFRSLVHHTSMSGRPSPSLFLSDFSVSYSDIKDTPEYTIHFFSKSIGFSSVSFVERVHLLRALSFMTKVTASSSINFSFIECPNAVLFSVIRLLQESQKFITSLSLSRVLGHNSNESCNYLF
jgi:hypothetical protein